MLNVVRGVLVAVLLGGALTACSTTASGLKVRFAKERGCAEGQVAVSEAGGEVYRASGCGSSAEYICDAFAGFGNSSQRCRERGLNPREPSGSPPAQDNSRPDLVSPK